MSDDFTLCYCGEGNADTRMDEDGNYYLDLDMKPSEEAWCHKCGVQCGWRHVEYGERRD